MHVRAAHPAKRNGINDTSCQTHAEDVPEMHNFLDYLATDERLPTLHPCTKMTHQGYRGVMATKDIPRGVALVRIARRCCLGPETTDESKDSWTKAMTASPADAVGAPQG